MKKVLLFVLAAMFAYTMNAQTLFSDGFESGDLSAWTLTDSDNDGNNWFVGGTADQLNVHGGSYTAVSKSYDNTVGALHPDNWMVTTTPVTIPASGYVLSWYDRGQDPNYAAEHFAVYVSTSNNISSMTTPVYEGVSAGDWAYHYASLDAYAGQSVYIAFRHYNVSDMFYLLIDDISIAPLSTEPEIYLASIDLGGEYGYYGDAFQVKGTVTNLCTSPLTSFSVSYDLNGTASSVYNVTGINVATGETYEFTHPDAPAYVVGDNTVTVTVSNPNGVADNTSDNTKSADMYIVECNVNTLPYTMGFEQGIIDDCWHIMEGSSIGNAYSLIQQYGSTLPFAAHSGINSIISQAANSMMYTQVELPAGASMINLSGYVMLSYDANNQYGSAVMSVLVSTTGTDRADFSVVGNNFIDVNDNSFVEFTADLTAYAGQTIYVALKHEQGAWIIFDDITIEAVNDTPEIALISNTTPTNVTPGSNFDVSGVVKNNSATALTSFDVTYTLDGTTSAVMNVTGINVAYGATYEFTHNVPANVQDGNHTLVITVSNPNGVADNTADNEISATVTGCTAISVPYSMGFENGMECWQAVSMNTANNDFGINGGAYPQYVGAYNGDNAFIFSSYEEADDYTQYLISPELNLTGDAQFSFFHKNGYSGAEVIQIMVSTTNNNISSFTALGDVINPTSDWTEAVAAIDANVKYVAIKYSSSYLYYVGIDDISLTELSLTPEMQLVSVVANPTSVPTNTGFNLVGTVKNNSGAPLTSFDMSYTVNGQTNNSPVSGINVALGQTYNFNIPVAGIATPNNYDITVTVSNPNGVADNTADNTLTTSVNVYDASTSVPRTTLLENFTTAVCQYCPSGHDRIEAAIGTTYANNVIWVSHHSGYGTDDLTSQLDQTMTTFYNDNSTYAPAIMLDRTYWGEQAFTYYNGEYAPGPVFLPQSDVADALALSTAEPAFVTVNLGNVNYNATTRALSVTVSGNVSGVLATNDARLNVWLLEDGLVADDQTGVGHGPRQRDANSASGYIDNFIHNHVIRENLSGDDWGEAGIVTPTAGTNYSKTYTTTVSNDYDASKCYIVAFVSSGNHSDVNNCKVFNAGKSNYITTGDTPGPGPEPGEGIDDVTANSVKLYPNPTTGNLFIEVEGLQKVEVIDAVGRVVMTETNSTINMSNLANGIYTVRVTANGNTAVKKVVKK